MLASLVVGISGYSIFTTAIDSGNILNMFSNTSVTINIARALFAMDMFLTYPLELFIARNTIFKVAEILLPQRFGKGPVALWLHILMTFILVTTTTVIGVSTCNLGAVLDLTGGFAAAGIAFIFPSACMIKLNKGPFFTKANMPHIICVVFGLFVLIMTTYTTLD
jgi:solute carrier family 38 (sodium-coupled neutral amino acid transporter), member 11